MLKPSLILIAFSLLAQDPAPAPKPAAPSAKKTEADPKRLKARELLDKAGETIAAATPEAQVAALMHIAGSYEAFDKKKALELLEQAFASAIALPEDRNRRESALGQIVNITASLDVDAALDMLRRFPAPVSAESNDPRSNAVRPIVTGLIQKKSYDRAMEAIEIAAQGGQYPYGPAGALMRALPQEDPRRLQIFGRASTAFNGRNARDFGQMISSHAKTLPQSVVETAVSTLVSSILGRTNDPTTTATISSAKGSVAFASRKEFELFDVMHVLRAVDPKRAAELLEKYPDLRAAVDKFPEGTHSMRESEESSNLSTSVNSGSSQRNPDAEARMVRRAADEARYAEAQRAASSDPDKAVNIAKEIQNPVLQARLLAGIANGVSQKDAASAKPILNQCMQALERVKEPQERVAVLNLIAEAAHRLNDDEQAWAALYKALDAATELHKLDTDPEAPNRAPRDLWPSTQAYRTVAHRAAALFGPDAEPLLVKIADPEMQLLATVHMARGLLGKDRGDTSTSVSRSRAPR